MEESTVKSSLMFSLQPLPDTAAKRALVKNVVPHLASSSSKITIVGAGQVGLAITFSLLTQRCTNEVALIDVDEEKLKGEMLDLQHGSQFIRNAKIRASSDYSITEGSKICIITAGLRGKGGESRLTLLQRNVELIKTIVPQLIKYSPNTILLVVSNPVDIITYAAWKLSGLPKNRVIGSGTHLDSSRFRFFISERLGIAPSSCHGYIIGEHGDSSVAVWSGVNVAGVRLAEIDPLIGTENDPDNWKELHKRVVNSAYEVIKLKKYTSWAIGLSVSNIVQAILTDSGMVLPVSVLIQGMHGFEQEVYLSLPAVMGENGVTDIIQLTLNEDELKRLEKSVNILNELQKQLKF